jgi:outer membrane protein assembly factor BamB
VSDLDRREIERRARAGDSASALRWARALERTGRRDEVLTALLLATGSAEGRAELGKLWETLSPTPGRFTDVPAIRAPRLRWLTKLDGRDTVERLIAHPLGIVVSTGRRTILIDPASGAKRRDLLPSKCPVILGDVLLLMQSNLYVATHDLATGESLHAAKVRGHGHFARGGNGLFVTGQLSSLHAYRMGKSRGTLEHAWSVETETNAYEHAEVVAGSLLVPERRRLRAFDTAGTALWATPSSEEDRGDPLGARVAIEAGDEELVLVASGSELIETLVALETRSGRERWRHGPPYPFGVAITPDRVFVGLTPNLFDARHGGYAFRALGRADGRVVATLRAPLVSHVFAREIAYAHDPDHRPGDSPVAVVAHDLAGRELWRFPGDELPGNATMLAVSAHGLVVAGNRFVACLEESA